MINSIQNFAVDKPIWGVCAGLIFLAKDVGQKQPILSLMDITVERNAFGNQLDSFTSDLHLNFIEEPEKTFPAVFIRAPLITEVGTGAEVLATLKNGQIIAARQDTLLATCFHPELTNDLRVHQYFLSMLSAS